MIGDILDIVNKFIPDKDAQIKARAELESQYQKTLKEAVSSDKEIRLAEMNSSGLSKHWRPLSALIVFFTLFVRFPLYWVAHMTISFMGLNVYLPELEALPIEFYGMATAFISIYAFGRNNEKIK